MTNNEKPSDGMRLFRASWKQFSWTLGIVLVICFALKKFGLIHSRPDVFAKELLAVFFLCLALSVLSGAKLLLEEDRQASDKQRTALATARSRSIPDDCFSDRIRELSSGELHIATWADLCFLINDGKGWLIYVIELPSSESFREMYALSSILVLDVRKEYIPGSLTLRCLFEVQGSTERMVEHDGFASGFHNCYVVGPDNHRHVVIACTDPADAYALVVQATNPQIDLFISDLRRATLKRLGIESSDPFMDLPRNM